MRSAAEKRDGQKTGAPPHRMEPAHGVTQQGVFERHDRPQDDLGGAGPTATAAAVGTCEWTRVGAEGRHGGVLTPRGATWLLVGRSRTNTC